MSDYGDYRSRSPLLSGGYATTGRRPPRYGAYDDSAAYDGYATLSRPPFAAQASTLRIVRKSSSSMRADPAGGSHVPSDRTLSANEPSPHWPGAGQRTVKRVTRIVSRSPDRRAPAPPSSPPRIVFHDRAPDPQRFAVNVPQTILPPQSPAPTKLSRPRPPAGAAASAMSAPATAVQAVQYIQHIDTVSPNSAPPRPDDDAHQRPSPKQPLSTDTRYVSYDRTHEATAKASSLAAPATSVERHRPVDSPLVAYEHRVDERSDYRGVQPAPTEAYRDGPVLDASLLPQTVVNYMPVATQPLQPPQHQPTPNASGETPRKFVSKIFQQESSEPIVSPSAPASRLYVHDGGGGGAESSPRSSHTHVRPFGDSTVTTIEVKAPSASPSTLEREKSVIFINQSSRVDDPTTKILAPPVLTATPVRSLQPSHQQERTDSSHQSRLFESLLSDRSFDESVFASQARNYDSGRNPQRSGSRDRPRPSLANKAREALPPLDGDPTGGEAPLHEQNARSPSFSRRPRSVAEERSKSRSTASPLLSDDVAAVPRRRNPVRKSPANDDNESAGATPPVGSGVPTRSDDEDYSDCEEDDIDEPDLWPLRQSDDAAPTNGFSESDMDGDDDTPPPAATVSEVVEQTPNQLRPTKAPIRQRPQGAAEQLHRRRSPNRPSGGPARQSKNGCARKPESVQRQLSPDVSNHQPRIAEQQQPLRGSPRLVERDAPRRSASSGTGDTPQSQQRPHFRPHQNEGQPKVQQQPASQRGTSPSDRKSRPQVASASPADRSSALPPTRDETDRKTSAGWTYDAPSQNGIDPVSREFDPTESDGSSPKRRRSPKANNSRLANSVHEFMDVFEEIEAEKNVLSSSASSATQNQPRSSTSPKSLPHFVARDKKPRIKENVGTEFGKPVYQSSVSRLTTQPVTNGRTYNDVGSDESEPDDDDNEALWAAIESEIIPVIKAKGNANAGVLAKERLRRPALEDSRISPATVTGSQRTTGPRVGSEPLPTETVGERKFRDQKQAARTPTGEKIFDGKHSPSQPEGPRPQRPLAADKAVQTPRNNEGRSPVAGNARTVLIGSPLSAGRPQGADDREKPVTEQDFQDANRQQLAQTAVLDMDSHGTQTDDQPDSHSRGQSDTTTERMPAPRWSHQESVFTVESSSSTSSAPPQQRPAQPLTSDTANGNLRYQRFAAEAQTQSNHAKPDAQPTVLSEGYTEDRLLGTTSEIAGRLQFESSSTVRHRSKEPDSYRVTPVDSERSSATSNIKSNESMEQQAMEVVGSMPSENREVFQQLTRTALELTQARSDAFFSQHGSSLITEAYHDNLPQSDAAKMLEELTQMEKETTAEMQTDFGRIQNRRRLEEVKRKRYEFEAYMKHQEKVKALKQGIRQRVHVDHGDEVIQGDYAMTTSENGTIGMDTVEEHVDLGINELGVAAIAVRVTAVRILPFEPKSNKWRKSSVSVTRTIEIDLLCCEDTRLLYAKLQRAHALASREHDGEGGRRRSPAVANMDAADTYRVFAALMNITGDGSRSGEVGGGDDSNVGFDSRSEGGGAQRPHNDEVIGGDLMLLGSQARKYYLGGDGGVAATASSKSDSGAVDSSRSGGRFAAAGRRSEQPSCDSISVTATTAASASRSLQSTAPAVKRINVPESSVIDAEKRVTSDRPVDGGSRNLELPEWRRRARAARQENAAAAWAAAVAMDDSSASAAGSLSPNMMSVHRSQATGIDSTDYSSATAGTKQQQPPTRATIVGQVSTASMSSDRVTIPKSTAANLASAERENVPALSPLSLRHGTYFRAATDDDAAFISAATMVPIGERTGEGADNYASLGHDASHYKSLGDRSDVRSVGGGDAGSMPIKSAVYARGQPAVASATVIDFSDEEESSSLRQSSYAVAETHQLQRMRRADGDDASGSQRAYNSSANSDKGQDLGRLNSSSSSAAQPLQGATAALGTADRFATANLAAAGGPIGSHVHASSSFLSSSLSGVGDTPLDTELSAIGRRESARLRNATSLNGGDANPSLKSTPSATSFHTPDGVPTGRQRHARQPGRTARYSDDQDGGRGGGAAGSSYSVDRGVRSPKESRADARSAESALVDGGSGGSSYITSQRQSLLATSRVSSVSTGSVGGLGGSGDAVGDWHGGSDTSERRSYQVSVVNGDGGLNSSAASAAAVAGRLSSAMAGIPHAEASTRAEDYERVRRRHLDVLSDMRRLRIAPLAVELRGGATEVPGNRDALVSQTGSPIMRNDY